MVLFVLVPLAMLAFAAFALAGIASLGFGAGVLAVKFLLVVAAIGLIGGFMRRCHQPGQWDARGHGPRSHRGDAQPRPSEEMFEEWHRLAHARDEVDSWAPDAD